MQPESIRNFLNGKLDDREFSQLETLFENSDTHPSERIDEALLRPDSIVESIRAGNASPATGDPNADAESDSFTTRMESWIAREIPPPAELHRLLDPARSPDEIGRIGKYRIQELLATGGMGVLFRAIDGELDRAVCIKMLHPAIALKPEAKIRFERESRAAARLRCERIVTLLDVGMQRELPYIVMQLLEGESLRARLSHSRKLDAIQSLHYLRQIVEGLRYAHDAGLIHRDIKPDNVWITRENDVKLLDFGLAQSIDESMHLTTTGGILGTPQYMSPEQVQGQSLDAPSDFFSVGTVLYEMLTGTKPFQKENLFSTMMAITQQPIDLSSLEHDPSMPPQLVDLLRDLLQKNAKERPQSAASLLARIKSIEEGSIHNDHGESTQRSSLSRFLRGPFSASYWQLGMAATAGMAMLLAAMMIYQATDKGTLVVRSTDPQIEIQIAKEHVQIKDPMTGRLVDIKIGETPLASGIYQLEMTDASKELVFSSSTIAIRRGEKTIVEVELKPQANSNDLPVRETDGLASKDATGTQVPTRQAILDPSFDLQARDAFAALLPKIPAMQWEMETPVSIKRMASSNRFADHAPLPGIERWSIEPSYEEPISTDLNSDQSLTAMASRTFVRIYERNGNLKYVLPCRTSYASIVKFDNKYPNLVAVGSYVSDVMQDYGGRTPDSFEFSIWRLDADHASLIGHVASESNACGWDQGYRLLFWNHGKLRAFRLDTGEAIPIHLSDTGSNEISDVPRNSVSPDGRYFVVRERSGMSFWDLHRNEFCFSVPKSFQIAWDGERRVAMQVLDPVYKRSIEIWNLESRIFESRFELPVLSDQSNNRDENARHVDVELSPDLRLIAWLDSTGNFTVRNLTTQRQHSHFFTNPVTSGRIEWEQNDSIRIVCTDESTTELATYRWTARGSEVHGNVARVTNEMLVPVHLAPDFQWTRAYGLRDGKTALSWMSLQQIRKNSNQKPPYADLLPEMRLRLFDLSSAKFSPSAPSIETYRGLSMKQNIPMRPYTILSSVSDRGDIAIAGSLYSGIPNSPATNTSLGESVLVSLDEPLNSKSLKGLRLSPQDLVYWSASGRFAAIRYPLNLANRDSSDGELALIVDCTTKETLTAKQLGLKDPVVGILPIGETFVVATKSKTDRRSSMWIVDPLAQHSTLDEYLTQAIAPFALARPIWGDDQFIVIETSLPASSSDKDIPNFHLVRLARHPSISPTIESVVAPESVFVNFSFDGQYLTWDKKQIDLSPGWTINPFSTTMSKRVYAQTNVSDLAIVRWSSIAQTFASLESYLETWDRQPLHPAIGLSEENALTFHPSMFVQSVQWHSQSNIVTWSFPGFLYVYDVDRRSQKMIPIQHSQNYLPIQLATDFGWLACDSTSLHCLDRQGSPLGRLVFDPQLVNGEPTNPRWILADGSIASQCSRDGLHIVYFHAGMEVRTESLQQFASSHPDLKIPTFEKIPFLNPLSSRP